MKSLNLSVKRISRGICLVVLPILCAVVGPIVAITVGFAFNQVIVGEATVQAAPQAAPEPSTEISQTIAQTIASEEPLPEASTGLLGSGTRTIGSMIFILALILMAMILLKRYMPHRFGPLGHKRRIQVLETVPIGDKRSLTLIEIDGNSLLLASTPTTVSLLKEIRLERNTGVDRSVQPEQKARLEAPVQQAARQAAPQATPQPARKPDDKGSVQRFKDTLAAEVRASSGMAGAAGMAGMGGPGPLARLSRLRQQLEAK